MVLLEQGGYKCKTRYNKTFVLFFLDTPLSLTLMALASMVENF